MILMAPNHLDLTVPFYAALYLGIIISPIDRFLSISKYLIKFFEHVFQHYQLDNNYYLQILSEELLDTFSVNKPKIVFCQSEKVGDVRKALNELALVAKVITFNKGNENGDIDFTELLENGRDEKKVESFW